MIENTPNAGSNSPLAIFNIIHTNGPFPEKGPGKTVFHYGESLKVHSIMLHTGQKIPPCAMERNVLFYIISGTSELIADEQKVALKPGTGAVVPKVIQSREMRAYVDLTVLAVQGR